VAPLEGSDSRAEAGRREEPSPIKKLKESIVPLEEDNARMKREIERGGDLWSVNDRPKDIADIMIKTLGRTKAEKAAREILNASKKQGQQP
jgi:hypothetical protein